MVSESGDGVWIAFVGDVSGTGPEAAAVTALARHSLRTASLLHGDRSKPPNLALLNQALHADPVRAGSAASSTEGGEVGGVHQVGRVPVELYCPVRLCPGQRGLDGWFANRGRPAPLILRSHGSIKPWTRAGGRSWARSPTPATGRPRFTWNQATCC
jgi:hypothetical protein